MKTADALKHYQTEGGRPASYAIAEALSITRQAVEQWGPLVPLKSALRLADITGGKLKITTADYIETTVRAREA